MSSESPDENLNRALIAPNSLKRKSTEGVVTTCKKRLLDDTSFEEKYVTDSEFLLIQSGQVNALKNGPLTEQFSQHYFSTQFEKAKVITNDPPNESESQVERNSLNVTKLNLTQMFNDDFEDDIQDIDMPCNQSQMFLEAAKKIGQLPRHPSQKLEELNGTIFKSKNASIYIQLQRTMHEENETNVVDDDFVDPELSQAMISSQYRKEIEDDFAKCEETICNMSNLHESSRSIDMNVALNMSCDPLLGVNEINWNSPLIRRPTPPSSLVKSRLAMFSKNKELVQATPKPHTQTHFLSAGPYFGLPIEVKSLIKEYKGIDELYGEFNE